MGSNLDYLATLQLLGIITDAQREQLASETFKIAMCYLRRQQGRRRINPADVEPCACLAVCSALSRCQRWNRGRWAGYVCMTAEYALRDQRRADDRWQRSRDAAREKALMDGQLEGGDSP